jgi:putative flippase GtrA
MPAVFSKLIKFLAVGIPAFLIAIPLNVYLVDHLGWPKPAAYALVLAAQVTINFFACILFVFKRDTSKSMTSQFILFMSGILAARVLDWGLYSILVKTVPIHYIAIQFFNVVIFSVAKFSFARRTIEESSVVPAQRDS